MNEFLLGVASFMGGVSAGVGVAHIITERILSNERRALHALLQKQELIDSNDEGDEIMAAAVGVVLSERKKKRNG